MLDMDYKKTFELAKAYAALGAKERQIMEYLFEQDFEGGYSELSKTLKMDQSNLRNTLKYLEALGVVHIGYCKYIDELKFKTNKNGKIITSHNPMRYCFIVDGWMDTLINQYHKGNIHHDNIRKKTFIDEYTSLMYEENEIKTTICY